MKRLVALCLLLLCLPLSIPHAEPPTPSVAALLTAAKQGDDAKIQSLLEEGVDVNAYVKGTGFTALMLAAQMNHLATVKLLLDKGAFVESPNPYTGSDATPLMQASGGWTNVAAGASVPEFRTPKSETDVKNQLRAMFKWRHGYYGIIQLLIERGADVNVKGADGSTPLIHAAFGCDLQTVKLLLDHGADVNAKTSGSNGGVTALINAAMLPWPDSGAKVKLLLEKGADINVKDQSGNTALTYAKQNHVESSSSQIIQHPDAYEVLIAEMKKNKAGSDPH